ncbi:NirA family protein [Lichenifustis flavocetrariae]|uniref:NirA family protein n=1 Tax=Lichenifustis flavocetrariae TaxID=2949735 RepID=A0AA41Z858_9HYPH|nr:NirA family protein [Lichenifustis flavocetrariae]MCW6512100.1 NirA family protein [Lichenifustis flavocetrariae]
MGDAFSPEQRRWLEGFASGAAAVRVIPPPNKDAGPSGPEAAHFKAQDRTVAAGKKLVDQEKWKRTENPFEAYNRLKKEALAGTKPKPDDNFRWRYHGLFYVAPAQDSYMCRLRIPNGILKQWQFAGIADIAERLGGGFTHVTTRANLQIREIKPENGPAVVEDLTDIGIVSRGSGADNIRNVTGTATAGIDPHELLDTRPHARAWHHHILNTREMYGLPRKFNVAFDGGGAIATLEDTNDIGFQAVIVPDGTADRAGTSLEPGVWYRLALGGITGHQDFARDTGVILKPTEAIRVADAIVRVFIDHGDRTNRNKARLKYVLDAWGFDKFLGEVETVLGHPLTRVDASLLPPRPGYDRLAHIGVHPQRQTGLNWIGVVLQTGRLSCDQMRALADISHTLGDGDIRLTVWQNLLVSGVPDDKIAEAKRRIEAIGLDWQTTPIRAGLIACTGNRGCKFAASDTKGHALAIADHCEPRVTLDQPVNIHVTGCHNSCAQHYIGDIGLIGAKVTINDEGDQVEGYHLHVGGGYGTDAAIAQLLYSEVKADEVPARVEGLLKAYLGHRAHADEGFAAFARRHDADQLRTLAAEALA